MKPPPRGGACPPAPKARSSLESALDPSENQHHHHCQQHQLLVERNTFSAMTCTASPTDLLQAQYIGRHPIDGPQMSCATIKATVLPHKSPSRTRLTARKFITNTTKTSPRSAFYYLLSICVQTLIALASVILLFTSDFRPVSAATTLTTFTGDFTSPNRRPTDQALANDIQHHRHHHHPDDDQHHQQRHHGHINRQHPPTEGGPQNQSDNDHLVHLNHIVASRPHHKASHDHTRARSQRSLIRRRFDDDDHDLEKGEHFLPLLNSQPYKHLKGSRQTQPHSILLPDSTPHKSSQKDDIITSSYSPPAKEQQQSSADDEIFRLFHIHSHVDASNDIDSDFISSLDDPEDSDDGADFDIDHVDDNEDQDIDDAEEEDLEDEDNDYEKNDGDEDDVVDDESRVESRDPKTMHVGRIYPSRQRTQTYRDTKLPLQSPNDIDSHRYKFQTPGFGPSTKPDSEMFKERQNFGRNHAYRTHPSSDMRVHNIQSEPLNIMHHRSKASLHQRVRPINTNKIHHSQGSQVPISNMPYQSPVVVSISDNSYVSASPEVVRKVTSYNGHGGNLLSGDMTTSTTATTTSNIYSKISKFSVVDEGNGVVSQEESADKPQETSSVTSVTGNGIRRSHLTGSRSQDQITPSAHSRYELVGHHGAQNQKHPDADSEPVTYTTFDAHQNKYEYETSTTSSPSSSLANDSGYDAQRYHVKDSPDRVIYHRKRLSQPTFRHTTTLPPPTTMQSSNLSDRHIISIDLEDDGHQVKRNDTDDDDDDDDDDDGDADADDSDHDADDADDDDDDVAKDSPVQSMINAKVQENVVDDSDNRLSPAISLDAESDAEVALADVRHVPAPASVSYSKLIINPNNELHSFGRRYWHEPHLASIQMIQEETNGLDQGGINSAIIAILFGIGATGMLVLVVGLKMRTIRERVAYRGRRRSLVPDTDFLINTIPIRDDSFHSLDRKVFVEN